MRAADLDLRELLSFEPRGGIIRFGNERALLLDAVALGLLRRELIETLGITGARALLTRFGYAHGWRTAETMRQGFPWDSEDEWRKAGGWLHTLQGLVRVEPTAPDVTAAPRPIGNSVWHDSYEAEQHLLHLGRAEEPVCWTLTGFASGYLSRAYGRDVYCREERCRGKGDAVCRLVGRPLEEWGDAFAPDLPFYQKACLDTALTQVTDELKRVERRLRTRRLALGSAATTATKTSGLVVQSEAMQHVLDLSRRVAQVDSTVLITGESGVGKERIARLIHDESSRAAGLTEEIHAARFRQDLYYRLRVIEIRVPPLRQRRDDILPLARTFLATTAVRTGRKATGGFTPAAAQQLLRYGWPGNVRELENAIERATVLATTSRIDVDDLPQEVSLAVPDRFVPDDAKTLAEVERDYITAVVRAAGGNRTKAAAVLGIGAATLYRKLKEYDA